jgi:hypothetical protein
VEVAEAGAGGFPATGVWLNRTESAAGSFLFEHDLFEEPVSTLSDRA